MMNFKYKEPSKKEPFELLEKKEENPDPSENPEAKPPSDKSELNVSYDLDLNLKIIKQEFNGSINQDLIIRQFKIGRKFRAFIVYLDGMVDSQIVDRDILQQFMNPRNFTDFDEGDLLAYILDNVLSVKMINKSRQFDNIINQILSGDTAIFLESYTEAVIAETRGFEKRAIEKPSSETVIRGSQEGFTENMRSNITMLRRLVKNKHLISEIMPLGKTDHSNCTLLYIDGLVNKKLLEEVKRRLKAIDTDSVQGDGMIEQYIEDNPYSIFPQILATERPDRAASFLIEGKVVIIGSGSPFAIAAPITFFHFFHTSEEHHLRWQYGTVLRYIRIMALVVSIFLPGLYVATVLFSHELIPTHLLISVAQSRETVPFPTVQELLMMEIAFELIREAGIRVPGVIGQTLGIIGALILGQAAVAAKLVTPILIIIVAVAGLGSFAIPNYSFGLACRILRFLFIFMGAISGFLGISVGVFMITAIASNMKSFGVPYFSPVAPKSANSSDLISRKPIFKEEREPDISNTEDMIRQPENSSYLGKDENGDENE